MSVARTMCRGTFILMWRWPRSVRICIMSHAGHRSGYTYRMRVITPKLERYNPILFCMNDSQYARDEDREREKAYLDKRFPEKSQFEK